MKLAYLLLSCSDAPRVTNVTKDWVFRLATHAAGYFLDMSGGRELMEFRVCDWFPLAATSKEWNDWQFDAGDHVVPMVASGLNVDLSPYDHFVLIIDKADAHSAASSPNRKYTHMSAQDANAAILCHELGHQYDSNHANTETPGGFREYGDYFCIMGAEGAKYSYTEASLNFVNYVGQPLWRYCDQCMAMFYDGYPDKGRCAGGPHLGPSALKGHKSSEAEFSFVLPHDIPGPGQSNWRYCNLCHSMFFDGYPAKGVCPGNSGNGHVAQGYMFVLQHDIEDTGQANWRYCQRCHALFYDGYARKGACPSGPGGHQAAGYNFSLPHNIPGHAAAGPGMVAPNVAACGWLDFGRQGDGRDLGPVLHSRPADTTVDLAPFRGAPPNGYQGVTAYAWGDGLLPGRPEERLVIEYRSRDGRDRGLPTTDAGGPGYVVIHQTHGSGRKSSSAQLNWLPVEQGATAYLEPGGIEVTIAGYDASRSVASVRIHGDVWPPAPGQPNWRYCRKCQAMFYDGYPAKGGCPAGGAHVASGWNFVLQHDTSSPGQHDWRFCLKCQSLFFDGNATSGHCLAQGHVPDGFNFTIPHDIAGVGQSSWRACRKCQLMFFDGNPQKGSCPQGGAHAAAAGYGYNYSLPHDAPGPGQADWRFCSKCESLFYDGFPSKGACRAGGGHTSSGYNFRLPHDTPGGGQDQWRYCRNCHGLYFDGDDAKGICVAPGHLASGFNLVLPHDLSGPGQNNWRYCGNCNEMFFDGYPTKGACPTGGAHSASGYNFVLQHR